jgi:mRNA interferase MazF
VVSINGIGRLPLKLVAPITDWKTQFSGRIWLVNVKPTNTNGLIKESAVDVLQVKSLDVQRFLTKRGQLTATLMVEVSAAIAAIVDYQ